MSTNDNLNTASGCTFAIAPRSASLDLTAAEYAALTWTTVGEVEDIGEFGDTFSTASFVSLADGRTRKYKGTADAGDVTIALGLDNSDAGQTALKAAHADRSKGNYPIRITLNDGDPSATPVVPPTTYYMLAKVTKNTTAAGKADNVVRRNVSISINSAITEVLPA